MEHILICITFVETMPEKEWVIHHLGTTLGPLVSSWQHKLSLVAQFPGFLWYFCFRCKANFTSDTKDSSYLSESVNHKHACVEILFLVSCQNHTNALRSLSIQNFIRHPHLLIWSPPMSSFSVDTACRWGKPIYGQKSLGERLTFPNAFGLDMFRWMWFLKPLYGFDYQALHTKWLICLIFEFIYK